MVNFTVVKHHYRDFTLRVDVETTAFGFNRGDTVIFREYAPGDRIPQNGILAVSRFGSEILEIGQSITLTAAHDEGQKLQKIRLWNNQVGEFYRDFNIHGKMIRPSRTSWEVRVNAGPCPLNK